MTLKWRKMHMKQYMQFLLILTIITFSAGISSGEGEIYRWIDDNGVVTYRDQPPPKTHKRKVKKYTDEDFPPDPPKMPPPKIADPASFKRARILNPLTGTPPSKAPGRSVLKKEVND
jgi:hypothetical protein